jgi:hypothetical protein
MLTAELYFTILYRMADADLDSLVFVHLGYLQQGLEEWEGLKTSLDQNHSPKKVEYVKVRIYPNTTIHYRIVVITILIILQVNNNNNNNCW